MLRSYFKTAIRSFWNNKIFSLINITGLTIGISSALVIFLIVNYDFSFDQFEKDGDRIYRVVTNSSWAGNEYPNSGVPAPLPEGVKSECTGIEQSTRFWVEGESKVTLAASAGEEDKVFRKQLHVVFADENYFDFIPYEWLAGGSATALKQPNTVVISESRAQQYFPGRNYADLIGKEIIYNDSIRTTITGVVKDLGETHITDFTFTDFISYATIEASSGLKSNRCWDSWGCVNSSSQFLVKLEPGTQAASVEKQLAALEAKHHEKDNGGKTSYTLQLFADLHFNDKYDVFNQRIANTKILYGLLAIAAFLLLLACINFINLTTAQAARRAKEIGIRKTMGASRGKLVFQVLSETFLLSLFATLSSIALAPLILKIFSDYVPEGFHFNILHHPGILLFALLLVAGVTLLSGFYPAMILSGYQPVLVLKNQTAANSSPSRKAWLRKSLTVTQFIIAQVFIMATLLVAKQIHYALNADMGYRKEAIININTPFNYYHPGKEQWVYADKIRAIPEIERLSVGNSAPASNTIEATTLIYKDGEKEVKTDVQFKYGDTAYIGLYGMKLRAGSNLHNSDSVTEFIINETYAKLLGFQHPADAVGKAITYNDHPVPITGVVADFHQRSIHDPIQPLAIASALHYNSSVMHIALKPQNGNDSWKSAIAKLETDWKEVYPDEEFSYEFFDESVAAFYKNDQRISALLTWSTALAVLISCLGLLGLVIYTTNQRTKEIGIRKVLGASVRQIASLLSSDFLKLVFIAFLLSVPIAWYGMNQWLQNFAYRTEISWWIFAGSGGLMVLIAVLTLSLQTIKAAIENPVKSLRSE